MEKKTIYIIYYKFYEQIIDEAADKIESFIQKTNSDNQIQ